MCWKLCSSCWSLYVLREDFLSALIQPPSLVRRFGPSETTVYLAQGPLSLIRCVWVPLIWDPDTWRDVWRGAQGVWRATRHGAWGSRCLRPPVWVWFPGQPAWPRPRQPASSCGARPLSFLQTGFDCNLCDCIWFLFVDRNRMKLVYFF
jgi:hypothetical protein